MNHTRRTVDINCTIRYLLTLYVPSAYTFNISPVWSTLLSTLVTTTLVSVLSIHVLHGSRSHKVFRRQSFSRRLPRSWRPPSNRPSSSPSGLHPEPNPAKIPYPAKESFPTSFLSNTLSRLPHHYPPASLCRSIRDSDRFLPCSLIELHFSFKYTATESNYEALFVLPSFCSSNFSKRFFFSATAALAAALQPPSFSPLADSEPDSVGNPPRETVPDSVLCSPAPRFSASAFPRLTVTGLT